MDRRNFLKALCAGSLTGLLTRSLSQSLAGLPLDSRYLPPPQINTYSSEIILNSRRSYHSGYSGALNDQILANILWACSRAPQISSNRIIYVARPDNLYRYDPAAHDLVQHLAGNHLSESACAFEVGVAADLAEDAGASLAYGLLAVESFWVTTSNQPIGIPKESARTNAVNTWNSALTIQMVNCHGLMASVSGVTSQLVAVSSDGTLPNPSTNGTMLLENALANLQYGTQFATTTLTLNQLSQLAWASYGNTPHNASGGKAALTVASAVANYYLTGRIYLVRPEGVERYHIRQPSGQQTTRDHRIERVTTGDRRPQLRSAISRLPQNAPAYLVYCATTASRYQYLEAGFAAASALLQATSLNLQGYFTANFSAAEQSAIAAALGIPATDLALEIFSVGEPLVGVGERENGPVRYFSAAPNPFHDRSLIRFGLAAALPVKIEICDRNGRRIKMLREQNLPAGDHQACWDGKDRLGRRVAAGAYFLNLHAGNAVRQEKLIRI